MYRTRKKGEIKAPSASTVVSLFNFDTFLMFVNHCFGPTAI